MLFVPPFNEFLASEETGTSTVTEAGWGQTLTSGAANTKPASTTLIKTIGSYDCYGLYITFTGGATSAATKRYLVDIYFDSVLTIPDLLVNSPAMVAGGYCYYFPIFIKAGTAIGARVQCSTAAATINIGLKGLIKPKRHDAIKYGTKVTAYGISAATTVGTTILPGTSSWSSFTSIGTVATGRKPWWWQLGLATNDTTMTTPAYKANVYLGASTSAAKTALFDVVAINNNTAEQMGKTVGMGGAFEAVPGWNIYADCAACTVASDSAVSIAVYGLE